MIRCSFRIVKTCRFVMLIDSGVKHYPLSNGARQHLIPDPGVSRRHASIQPDLGLPTQHLLAQSVVRSSAANTNRPLGVVDADNLAGDLADHVDEVIDRHLIWV